MSNSAMNKKIVDTEIERDEAINARNLWCGVFFFSAVINILLIGALCIF